MGPILFSLVQVLFQAAIFLLMIPSISQANLYTYSKTSVHTGYSISLLVGPGFDFKENHQGESTIPVYGVAGGYTFPNRLELGAEFVMTGSVPTMGIDANYFFYHQFFLGAQGGLDFSTTTTEYVGPQIGADYPVTIHSFQFLVGPEIQYLYTFHDRGGILETLLSLKHYF